MSNTIYCVYLTTYSGDLLPPFYIGSSTVDKVLNGYRGSVLSKKWKEIWKQELKDKPDLFDIEILKTFATRPEATEYELKCQKEVKAVKNPIYINESYATVNGYFGRNVRGENNPRYGRTKENDPIIAEMAIKISNTNKEYWKHHPNPRLGCKAWNNGLTKETNNGVMIQAIKIKELYNSEEGQKSLAKGRQTRKLKDELDPTRIEKRRLKLCEAQANMSDEMKQQKNKKVSAALKGKPKSHDHRQKLRKLTDDEEDLIRQKLNDNWTVKEILEFLNFKVSQQPIYRIKTQEKLKCKEIKSDSTNIIN